MAKNNGPKDVIKVGTVQVSVWENQFNDGVSLSYQLSKNYLDNKDNKWKTTSSLKANELAFAICALQEAFDRRYKREKTTNNEDF